MKPIDPQQVQGPVQTMLAILSDEKQSTPNNLLEGVVSGKSLLRAILQGNLFICQPGAPEEKNLADEPVDDSAEDDGAEAK